MIFAARDKHRLKIFDITSLLGTHVIDVIKIGIKASVWSIVRKYESQENHCDYEPLLLLYLPLSNSVDYRGRTTNAGCVNPDIVWEVDEHKYYRSSKHECSKQTKLAQSRRFQRYESHECPDSGDIAYEQRPYYLSKSLTHVALM